MCVDDVAGTICHQGLPRCHICPPTDSDVDVSTRSVERFPRRHDNRPPRGLVRVAGVQTKPSGAAHRVSWTEGQMNKNAHEVIG